MKAWLKEFLQQLLSNSPGVSFGRFMSFLISSFVLGWDTSYIVIAYQWNHHLPPSVAPVGFLPDGLTLAAQIAFMTAFYGVTKYGDINSPDHRQDHQDRQEHPDHPQNSN